ncbi:MAG: chemotaxis protein CheW [Pseudomonadales bacterium]
MPASESRFDWDSLKNRLNDISKIGNEERTIEQIRETLVERAERFRREESTVHNETEEMIVFQEGDERYAIPLRMLSEIRPITRMTPLPLVSKNILGVINFRGKIVAMYGLSRDSHKKTTETLKDSHQGDVHHGQKIGSALIGHGIAANLALFADQVIGTLSISAAEIREAPISLGEFDYIRGVGTDGLIFLDLENLVKNKQFYMA